MPSEDDEKSEISNGSQEGHITPQRMASDKDSYLQCADENIVNVCVINLLETLAQLYSSKRSNWTLARLGFTAKFEKGEYTAMTDGALYTKDKHIVQAIVEVKPNIRSSIVPEVQKQEASEIVGSLKNSTGNKLPELGGHRLLVGQNRHEIYLMFAKPDEKYQAYLETSENAKKDQGFLSIQAYGPWWLTKKEDLDELCEILLAIIIRASEAAGALEYNIDIVEVKPDIHASI
ncbi:hypothetical protein TCE0_018r05999 [Talaromyces pinophilus]|uniref:Uncharacterized protein n=1 Tax=Talaromyces pinophilus TaxID=128442 RepID=A0A510NWQ8_TALPI|nr:hypothetical protein TCE0_018r05999 [Talaromyces pinophilus]